MINRRAAWRIPLLLGVFALVAAACGGETAETQPPATQPPATTQPPAATQPPAPTTTEEMMEMGEPVTLTLGHPFPEQHPIHQGALLPFAEAVSAATDGTVTIEFFPGGSIGPAPATYDNTVTGAQDVGWALQGYHAGVFPASQVIELPFQFTSAVQATEILWELYDEFPALQEEYSDVKLLGLWVHDIGDLWTKEGFKVETLEDIEGLRLRFPTATLQPLITKMGAEGVGMPAPQIFDNLEANVIDGLMIAVSGLQSFQLYPQLAYGVTCDCYVAAQYLVANLDSWNALSPAQQAAIDELSGRVVSLEAATVYDGLYVSISERAIEEGIEKATLSDEELARWHALGDEVVAEWIVEREEEGVPAQDMFDRMQELIAAG